MYDNIFLKFPINPAILIQARGSILYRFESPSGQEVTGQCLKAPFLRPAAKKKEPDYIFLASCARASSTPPDREPRSQGFRNIPDSIRDRWRGMNADREPRYKRSL